MSLTVTDVVEFIKNLKVSEVSSLVKILEAELGVSAGAPMMVASAAPAAAAVVEEKTEFDVHIADFGANKINVIKAVRELTGLGLKEAKDLVEAAPCIILAKVKVEDAAKNIEKLKAETGGDFSME